MRGSNWGEERPAGPRRGRWSQVEVGRPQGPLRPARRQGHRARAQPQRGAACARKAEELFRSAAPQRPLDRPGGRASSSATWALEPPEVIARILGRDRSEEVERQIFALGRIQQDGEWTREEMQQFRRVYGTRSDDGPGADLRAHAGARCSAGRASCCLAKDKAFLKRQRARRRHAHAALGARASSSCCASSTRAPPTSRSPGSSTARSRASSPRPTTSGLKKAAERLRGDGPRERQPALPRPARRPRDAQRPRRRRPRTTVASADGRCLAGPRRGGCCRGPRSPAALSPRGAGSSGRASCRRPSRRP